MNAADAGELRADRAIAALQHCRQLATRMALRAMLRA